MSWVRSDRLSNHKAVTLECHTAGTGLCNRTALFTCQLSRIRRETGAFLPILGVSCTMHRTHFSSGSRALQNFKVDRYGTVGFFCLSNTYLLSFLPFTTMIKMFIKSFTVECNLRNRNNGIIVLLKALRKTMCHKDATIFHYVHCVPLSIFNVLTVISSVESDS